MVWRIEPGETPDELRVTHFGKDGAVARLRGAVIRLQAHRNYYLDLTPEGAPPTSPAAHAVLKLERSRVSALSIGTTRGMRREFGGKVAKSYERLTLVPPRSSKLRDLPGGPKAVYGPLPGEPTGAATFASSRADVAELLKHLDSDSGLWKEEADGTTLVRRTLENKAD